MKDEEIGVLSRVTQEQSDILGGIQLLPVISELINHLRAKSVLDYGCGKGGLVRVLQEKFPDIKVCGYDPAVKEFEKFPSEKFDLIVNIDVLEHIPEDELTETIERMKSLSENIFFHLHHGEVAAVLPNGENAHCTVWTPEEYWRFFKKFFSESTVLPSDKHFQTIYLTFKLPEEIKKRCRILKQGDLKFIDKMADFMKILDSQKDVIIFSRGYGGNRVLDYLQFSDNLKKVLCLTETTIPYDTGHFFNHEMAVIPLKNLPHFRDSAIFVVVAPFWLQKNISIELTEFGCKDFVFLGENAYKEICEALKEFLTPDQVMIRLMNHISERLNLLEDQVEWQNDIRAVHTRAFAEYRNAFRDKKVVIVGSGPSAKYYKPISDAIHIALNYSWRREDISFDYLFTGDRYINKENIRVQDGFDRIKDKIFVYMRMASERLRWLDFGEDVSIMDRVRRFYISSNPDRKSMCQDICLHPLFIKHSIAEAALDFALFAYPKEIYLVGCDCSNSGYFYKSTAEQLKDNKKLATSSMRVNYARFKTFADQYYPDTEIISINPVGLKGLFKDIYTDEYKKFLETIL